MKRGILFFYNMGNITLIARIALVPLIWMLTRTRPPAFFGFLALFIISLLVAMIPSPSDKSMMRAIEEFHEEAENQMRDESEIRDTKKFIVVHGYRKSGAMRLRRRVGREVVYPFPTADCQASATPKNASKGESQPKHFLGLKLIDKTIFCKVSLSKE